MPQCRMRNKQKPVTPSLQSAGEDSFSPASLQHSSLPLSLSPYLLDRFLIAQSPDLRSASAQHYFALSIHCCIRALLHLSILLLALPIHTLFFFIFQDNICSSVGDVQH